MATAADVLTLRTNLADYPVTRALREGRVSSDLVALDFCGPEQAHNGLKAMLREHAYDCGELAIVTLLQAKANGAAFDESAWYATVLPPCSAQ